VKPVQRSLDGSAPCRRGAAWRLCAELLLPAGALFFTPLPYARITEIRFLGLSLRISAFRPPRRQIPYPEFAPSTLGAVVPCVNRAPGLTVPTHGGILRWL